jgi:hypothetical protein
MPLYVAEQPKRRRATYGSYRYESIGYRTYPTAVRAGYADRNLSRFRRLLLRLKEGTAGALELFSGLLCLIYDDLLDSPDAIACVPSSGKSGLVRDDPLALMVQMAVLKGIGAVDGSSWLLRTESVAPAHKDNAMRDYRKQLETIACNAAALPGSIESILLVDDIRTSGSTMDACVDRLKEAFPAATITGFAFGYTDWVPDQSPCMPDWPEANINQHAVQKVIEAWQSEAWPLPAMNNVSPFFADGHFVHAAGRACCRPTADCTAIWDKHQADATLMESCPRCKPFAHKPVFIFNKNTATIHQVDCRTGPARNGSEPLWSLRHGIRRGGKPCRNCMHGWPMARELVERRRAALIAQQQRLEEEARREREWEEMMSRTPEPFTLD